jgi:hypothetical protein
MRDFRPSELPMNPIPRNRNRFPSTGSAGILPAGPSFSNVYALPKTFSIPTAKWEIPGHLGISRLFFKKFWKPERDAP